MTWKLKGVKIIDKSDALFLPKLKSFIESELNKSISFRYFQSRPIEIIENHVYTILLEKDDRIIGYAHLDRDENDPHKIWLGIAVDRDHHGNGYGKLLMDNLLEFADKNLLDLVLSVDLDNLYAIKLYEKYGFDEFQKYTSNVIMIRKHE